MKNSTKIYHFIALATLVASAPSIAVEIRGAISCGKWQEQRLPGSVRWGETWLIGYLSGQAIALDRDFLKGTDNASIFLWMDSY